MPGREHRPLITAHGRQDRSSTLKDDCVIQASGHLSLLADSQGIITRADCCHQVPWNDGEKGGAFWKVSSQLPKSLTSSEGGQLEHSAGEEGGCLPPEPRPGHAAATGGSRLDGRTCSSPVVARLRAPAHGNVPLFLLMS